MAYLVLMCGPSYSGKSTFAQHLKDIGYFGDVEIVSTDAIRKEMLGDESDQSCGDAVFGKARAMVRGCLNADENVIVDATNLTPRTRKEFLRIGREYNATIYLVWMEATEEELFARVSKRERVVPENVVRRQIAKSVVPTLTEGNVLWRVWKSDDGWAVDQDYWISEALRGLITRGDAFKI